MNAVVSRMLLLSLMTVANAAVAQTPSATVTIAVVDSAAQALPLAIVTLVGHARPQSRTGEDGRVMFAEVSAGSYELRIIRVGYQPIARWVSIGTSDTTLVVTMHPTVARLADVEVRARRTTGISGKVGRAADWVPVAGAIVVIFGGRTMRTDSAGSFEAPEVRPGGHMLRVSRAGFVPQMRSVTVPPAAMVELAFLLDTGRAPVGREALVVDLDQRQRWRGSESAMIPREELARYGRLGLGEALRGAPSFVRKSLVLSSGACVFVDGEPRPGWPLDAFDASEVEAVEVYAGRSEMSNTLRSRWPSGIPCGSGATPPARGPARRTPGAVSMVVIWLKPRSGL